MSNKRTRIVCSLYVQLLLLSIRSFEIHSCCCICKHFLLFYAQIKFYCMDIPVLFTHYLVPVFCWSITNHSKPLKKLTSMHFTHEPALCAWHGWGTASRCWTWHQLGDSEAGWGLESPEDSLLCLVVDAGCQLGPPWNLSFRAAWQLGSKDKAEVWGVFMTKPQKSQSITFFILYWP